jgi:hypothetical protein
MQYLLTYMLPPGRHCRLWGRLLVGVVQAFGMWGSEDATHFTSSDEASVLAPTPTGSARHLQFTVLSSLLPPSPPRFFTPPPPPRNPSFTPDLPPNDGLHRILGSRGSPTQDPGEASRSLPPPPASPAIPNPITAHRLGIVLSPPTMARNSAQRNANDKSDPPVFQCGICQQRYRRADHLARHARIRKLSPRCRPASPPPFP